MTTLREAATMALEALEYHVEQTRPIDRTSDAITALRAALAEPVQEPVAWIYADPDKPGLKFLEWREDAFGYEGEWIKTPLYTAPPRKPLTEEEIDNLPWNGSPRQFARAIERSHKIGGQDESA